jgi:hypothetical protein
VLGHLFNALLGPVVLCQLVLVKIQELGDHGPPQDSWQTSNWQLVVGLENKRKNSKSIISNYTGF